MKLQVRGLIPSDGIAIIGSRTPPPEAEVFAYELARSLNEPVIAGLAPGIDMAAHRGALDARLSTLAFLAYGFGAADSPEQSEFEERIVEAGGAVATLLPPGTRASEASRIARDRLQAQYARAVVLVCTEIDGGAMHAMRFAQELRKSRFAVLPPPEMRSRPQWAGNLACIAEGAMPLPFDVAEALSTLT